jgi:polyisoprenyl-phosphate glycosyltransferase
LNRDIDICIIIPFLNEEDNISMLSGELNKLVQTNDQLLFEIILVNDGSTDASKQVIKEAVFPQGTRLINFSQNFGSHAALRAGISIATAKYITFLYADLQDPVMNVMTMHNRIEEGYDIVWAFREQSNNSRFEKFFSRYYAHLMKKYVNRKYPSKGFDVVMFNRKVARELNKNVEANSSLFLQILNLGFNTSSISYNKSERKAGKSKWTLAKKIKLLIDSFVAFSFAPIRFVSVIGIIFFMVGTAWTVYIVIRKLLFNDLAMGWPALMSILMLGFGITNISLGIIAEYLWRTLDVSRRRPVFVIDEIVELSHLNKNVETAETELPTVNKYGNQ